MGCLVAIMNFRSRGGLRRGINYHQVAGSEAKEIRGGEREEKKENPSPAHPIPTDYTSNMVARY